LWIKNIFKIIGDLGGEDMDIEFFDDPLRQPKARDEVRIKQIGLFIHDDLRCISFGLELTPFLERPSIQVTIRNGQGNPAGALTVIETMTPNFSLIVHLRDEDISDPYELTAEIYYATPETVRLDVDRQTVIFNATAPSEYKFRFA
jgi:hypothetical protein